MKAIILTAGEGTRLRPYTLDRPKCLVEADGRSLLDRQMEVLTAGGVSDIVLIKGYLADRWERPGTRAYLNPLYASTNMVSTLFCAREEFGEEAIISYGDIVYSPVALRKLLQSTADISVVIDRGWEAYWRERSPDPLSDAETLKIGADGCIAEIGQKPKSFAEIEGQYIGLMKFSPRGFAALAEVFDGARLTGSLAGKSPEKLFMTDVLQELIKAGKGLHPVFIDGGWVEVDTVEDLNLRVTKERLRAIAAELGVGK